VKLMIVQALMEAATLMRECVRVLACASGQDHHLAGSWNMRTDLVPGAGRLRVELTAT
jgi:hypothetical protein